jgi:hypothetical protein
MMERARLVAVRELAVCDYELTVQTPEACPVPRYCGESLLKGATAAGDFNEAYLQRTYAVQFNEVRTCSRQKGWRTSACTRVRVYAPVCCRWGWGLQRAGAFDVQPPSNSCIFHLCTATKQEIAVQRWWREGLQQVSLGKFAHLDRERCRWRIENGTDDPACTVDAYGQRRRRGWVNLECDPGMLDARAKVVAAEEPAACEYELSHLLI